VSKTRKIPDTISGQLRWFLEHSGQTFYGIAQETGIDAGLLSRFARSERTVTLATADKLARHLGLRLVRDEG